MKRLSRLLTTSMVALLFVGVIATPATAQVLPEATEGSVGQVLAPLEDQLDVLSDNLGDFFGDFPLDNAVTLSAADAVESAIALSLATFPEARTVLLGRDNVFADSLSSVAAQGIVGAPLLLTATDALDERTVAEMDRLGAQEVIILGSTTAISESVQQALEATYGKDNVTRYGGPSRVETAVELAFGIAPQADHIVLSRAFNEAGTNQSQAYADALSAGPYASSLGIPALLTTTEFLHPETLRYITEAGVDEVSIVGGVAAVGQEVEDELLDLGVTINRLAGVNRWDTSIVIANAMGVFSAADANRIILSEGGDDSLPIWAAGFAAAAHGAVYESPVILADGPLLPPETIAWIADGLTANALRLSNQPVICNSFVDFLACETTALMLLGTLDEANQLSGGALEAALGTPFQALADLLASIIPGPDEATPGLLGQVAALIGVFGSETDNPSGTCGDGIDNDEDQFIDEADECEEDSGVVDLLFAGAVPTVAAEQGLEHVLSTQPDDVVAALEALVGGAGDRVSPTTQVVITDALAALNESLPGPVDTSDEDQADALIAMIDSLTPQVHRLIGTVPLGEDIDVQALVADIDTTVLADLIQLALDEIAGAPAAI